MSGISRKVMEMSELSGKKSCHGKLPRNFHNCVNRLFSSTHLVLYANYSNLYLCHWFLWCYHYEVIFIAAVSRYCYRGSSFRYCTTLVIMGLRIKLIKGPDRDEKWTGRVDWIIQVCARVWREHVSISLLFGGPSGCWSTARHAVVLTLMKEYYYCIYLYMLCRLMYWHMLLIYTHQLPVSGLWVHDV